MAMAVRVRRERRGRRRTFFTTKVRNHMADRSSAGPGCNIRSQIALSAYGLSTLKPIAALMRSEKGDTNLETLTLAGTTGAALTSGAGALDRTGVRHSVGRSSDCAAREGSRDEREEPMS